MNIDAMKVIDSLALKIADMTKRMTILEVENAELKAELNKPKENVE